VVPPKMAMTGPSRIVEPVGVPSSARSAWNLMVAVFISAVTIRGVPVSGGPAWRLVVSRWEVRAG
jgi:hypothetical protein